MRLGVFEIVAAFLLIGLALVAMRLVRGRIRRRGARAFIVALVIGVATYAWAELTVGVFR